MVYPLQMWNRRHQARQSRDQRVLLRRHQLQSSQHYPIPLQASRQQLAEARSAEVVEVAVQPQQQVVVVAME